MAHRLDSLKTQRLAAGLSVRELARKANVPEIWIARAEATDTPSQKGNPLHPDESRRLADALGVTVATLGKVDV
jgi:transcriptional regulator with XRE-family HTH domain